MILQCPACQTQYRVKQGSIGPEGRRVKCAKCQNSWVAQPDSLLENQNLGQESSQLAVGAEAIIPTPPPSLTPSVKPIFPSPAQNREAREENVHSFPDSAHAPNVVQRAERPSFGKNNPTPHFSITAPQKKKKTLITLLIAFGVLFVLCTSFIIARKQVVNVWEGSAKIFDLIGLHVTALAEGLKIENIKTSYQRDAEGTKIILLEGEIKNYSEQEMVVPRFKIFPYKRVDKNLSNARFKVNAEKLKPGESTQFSANLPQDVRLHNQDEIRFVSD